MQYRNVRSANGEVLEGKKYTYDALGNITRISQSTGHFYPLVAYEYDAQNQLTKETYYDGKGTAAGNITRTISYTYDTAGNILSETRTEDGETTTKTYGYGDSGWVDLLTEVDGQAITYDASGNPTSYFGRTMTWTNGRQLKTSTTHAFGAVLRSTYAYDADGIRKTKTIPINQRGLTCTYTFVTQNGKVVRQSWRTESIDFFYDESGRPFAMTYEKSGETVGTYYYVLNLQGDVVKLVDVSGAEVASYEYDAWGNVLSQSGSMASTNPLRYRGYYRDSETGFYYLQSRYYDPAMHRFINADSYASTGQGFIGINMFAYCGNDPVNCYDPSGHYNLNVNLMETDSGWSTGGTNPSAYPIGTINGQGRDYYNNIPFGLSTIGNSGCATIATYNAMWLSGRTSTLRSVIEYYEGHFSPRWFGVTPREVARFLDDHNITYSNVRSFDEASTKLRNGGVAIITFWNAAVIPGTPIINMAEGAHTVAVTATASGSIRVYNAHNKDESCREYGCWEDYIGTGVFMSGYYIAN